MNIWSSILVFATLVSFRTAEASEVVLKYSSFIVSDVIGLDDQDTTLETRLQYSPKETPNGDNSVPGTVKPRTYSVYWNTPSETCSSNYGVDVDVRHFGVKENQRNGWVGDEITIFYAKDLGLYPYITPTGQPINGGIPQLGNLEAHLSKATDDVKRFIPNANFSGLGVIDWERWSPVWEKSSKLYHELSVSLVRKEHPDWSLTRLEAEAKAQFETAAKRWMVENLRLVKSLRPLGRWGYYLFPGCPDRHARTCPKKDMKLDDQIVWLMNESTALYPSAYLKDYSLTRQAKIDIIYNRVSEALRMRAIVRERFNKTVPIYLYNRYRYLNDQLYSKLDLLDTAGQPMYLGIEGTVLWDTTVLASNKTICQRMKTYVDTILGPTVRDILLN